MKTIKVSEEFLDEIIVEELKQDFIDTIISLKDCKERSKENPLDVSNLNEYERLIEMVGAIDVLLEYYMYYSEYVDWKESIKRNYEDIINSLSNEG